MIHCRSIPSDSANCELDLELWSKSESYPISLSGVSFEAICCIDPHKIPLWMVSGPSIAVYSQSDQTETFFRDLFHVDELLVSTGMVSRGLLLKACSKGNLDGIIVFGQIESDSQKVSSGDAEAASDEDVAKLSVSALPLFAAPHLTALLATKTEFSECQHMDSDENEITPVFLLPSKDDLNVLQSTLKRDEKLENLTRRSNMRKLQFGVHSKQSTALASFEGSPGPLEVDQRKKAARSWSSDTQIVDGTAMQYGVLLNESTERDNTHHKIERHQREATQDVQVMVKLEDPTKLETATEHMMQRLILAALRMRGLTRDRSRLAGENFGDRLEKDTEFKQLYHQTYRAAFFALVCPPSQFLLICLFCVNDCFRDIELQQAKL